MGRATTCQVKPNGVDISFSNRLFFMEICFQKYRYRGNYAQNTRYPSSSQAVIKAKVELATAYLKMFDARKRCTLSQRKWIPAISTDRKGDEKEENRSLVAVETRNFWLNGVHLACASQIENLRSLLALLFVLLHGLTSPTNRLRLAPTSRGLFTRSAITSSSRSSSRLTI